MAKSEETDNRKYLEYAAYCVVIALVLVAVYQITRTHRIVLLQREQYTSTATDSGDGATVEAQVDAVPDAGA